ncbi:Dehydroquinate synthase-like protein [Hypoxylon rubiginosum]|uniref:Dehydroquinate synthase-like protein n=1 Tax=Hypoxylon rubiginosum TaxID=110542 RepID=A0ACC0DF96_9PEZI|nr:Dehydroquinate synthase-like protein [Hypoxylon rubiginosum]
MAASGESFFLANPPQPKPSISHGLTFDKACAHHAANTFHASRIYVIVSRSISKTDDFTALKTALGDKIVGVRYGILPHTPWDDVLALTADIKAESPDLIITLGGGSITDGVKLARLFEANDVLDMDGVDAIYAKCKLDLRDMTKSAPGVKPAGIPVINVVTTLSAGEFTPAGGATDLQTHEKRILLHPSMMADIVMFDPALTLSTPARFWFSTGVRAVDHCTEGSYGNLPRADPSLNTELIQALRQLLVSLLETKKNWDDLDARLRSQLALSTAVKAIVNGMGASHGIGHQLGPLGVGHGETSCIVLPYVMKYNWTHGGDEARAALGRVASAFWDEPTVVEALGLKESDRDSTNPGDLVAAFVSKLGLPQSLGQFNIGSDQFGLLAENSLTDPCTIVNPVKLDKEKVIEILQMAA